MIYSSGETHDKYIHNGAWSVINLGRIGQPLSKVCSIILDVERSVLYFVVITGPFLLVLLECLFSDIYRGGLMCIIAFD